MRWLLAALLLNTTLSWAIDFSEPLEGKRLFEPAWFTRLSTVETLARAMPGRKDLGPVVIDLLQEPDPAVREIVISALERWKLDKRTTFRVIAEALQDPEPVVRLAAVDLAGRQGREGSSLRTALEPLLHDPSNEVRPYAALAMAVINYEPANLPAFTAFWTDDAI